MKINQLPKIKSKSKKRIGRGYGSGKGGHTATRGQKGQKTRSDIGLLFEGTKMRKSLIRRLPMQRGKYRFKTFKKKPFIINVKYLNIFENGEEVNLETLIKKRLVDESAKERGVKILGDGNLEKSLLVSLPVSKGAKKKIEKAGGKIIALEKEAKEKREEKEKKREKKKKATKVKKEEKVKKKKRKTKSLKKTKNKKK